MQVLCVILGEGVWRGELTVHFLREVFHHHIGIPMAYQKIAAVFITLNIMMVTV